MEVKVPNDDNRDGEVPGVEVAVGDDMVSSYWPNVNRLDGAASDGVVRGSPSFEFEDENGKHLQMNRKSLSGSSNCSFTTKTA